MDLMILGWELPALLVAGWLALWVSRRRIPAWYFAVAIGACFASFLLGLAVAVVLNARGTGDKFEGASKALLGAILQFAHRRVHCRDLATPDGNHRTRAPPAVSPYATERGDVGKVTNVTTENTYSHAAVAGALLVEDLLAQYVSMPAVLSELTQDVKVHPAQRERAAPVAVDHVVQPQG